jgi:hypothetical protein
MCKFPDEIRKDEKNAQWAWCQMGVMLRRWRKQLRDRFIPKNDEEEEMHDEEHWLPWLHNEPVQEEQWERFKLKYASRDYQVKLTY